ncbi:unnamed protein product [Mytilus edulis]|uniref:SGNH hydrolase-type esterase domain-containing protein n=1 Tax=Mytilus edulis TaxID=6550 RepID=A0A8S3RGH9_MYTED|nr:unnamed protein product [Mytilus edulis]
MPRGNSKKGQGVKRRRMADPKEKEQAIASVVNPRSSGESVIDFSSDPGPSQTSTGTESNIFNENIQFSQSLPCLEESLFDQIGCYVPMKLKDKIWKHEFIDLNLLIKSPRELANFPDHEGDLVVKGGHMRIESLPCRAIPNIHTWTSAFMIYMSILLEKQSSLAQELLKYMRDIRFAANKSHGWGTYDEQFRLRKAQRPQSSWAVINQDLWSFYITTAMRDQGQSNESKVGFSSQSEPLHSFRQSSGQQNVQPPRTCNAYNTKGKQCHELQSTVWIMGSSIPHWAGITAASRSGGKNLNLDRLGVQVKWITKSGMKWKDLDSSFESEIKKWPAPNYIFIHLGANDLVSMKSKELIENIKCSILRIKVFAPDIRIIWSDILPRPYWHGTLRPKLVEIARKRVNCAVRSFIKTEGQYISRYPAIKASEHNLFRHDGCHLSQVGIGIFLNNIQAAIETFVLGVAKVFPPDK